MKRSIVVLGIVAMFVFFVSASNVLSQPIDYCEGNFDYDDDQDGTDAYTFKTDFGRSTFGNPCPTDGPAPIPKTGQTTCYSSEDPWGAIDCAGTGQDGDLQKGIEWPSPRFTDNQDGTVVDHLTGLIWLKTANCFYDRTWAEALSDCNNLGSGACGLTDESVAGDWRLPNRRELLSLVDDEHYSPALPTGHPFLNVVVHDIYWSSTSIANDGYYAWAIHMNLGEPMNAAKRTWHWTWCVRGGH